MPTKSKKPEPKVVTIRRKWWSDAKVAKEMQERDPTWEQALTTESGHMCCLGFVSRACLKGVAKGDMLNVYRPSSLDLGGIPDWLEKVEQRAMDINDNEKITRRERESKLKKLFAKKTPIRLRFVP